MSLQPVRQSRQYRAVAESVFSNRNRAANMLFNTIGTLSKPTACVLKLRLLLADRADLRILDLMTQ
jgi:hypothetical protein